MQVWLSVFHFHHTKYGTVLFIQQLSVVFQSHNNNVPMCVSDSGVVTVYNLYIVECEIQPSINRGTASSSDQVWSYYCLDMIQGLKDFKKMVDRCRVGSHKTSCRDGSVQAINAQVTPSHSFLNMISVVYRLWYERTGTVFCCEILVGPFSDSICSWIRHSTYRTFLTPLNTWSLISALNSLLKLLSKPLIVVSFSHTRLLNFCKPPPLVLLHREI